ncbi:MAG: acyltransferase [Clostridia bacterium]|nr:acyltransferase [Bacilli bacterium]MBR3511510.1 acyltransferase [Clostridia bacterium]
MGKKRVVQLDSLRFFMCCMIVISHFEFLKKTVLGNVYEKHFWNPILAVDYFFVLSGFGMYLSDKRPGIKIKECVRFAIEKIKKIYPAYIFSLFLGIIWMIIEKKSILKIIICSIIDLTCLQSLTGTTSISHGINGVCWFLSSLFVTYILAPIFLNIIDNGKLNKKVKVLLFFTFVSLIITSGVAYKIDSLHLIDGKINDLYYGHPFVRCWYVFLGMIIGRLYKDIKITYRTKTEAIIIAFSIGWYLFRNSFTAYEPYLRIVDIIVVTLLVYIFSKGGGKITKFLNNSKFVKLGKHTMYIYLFHYPVRMTLGAIFEKNNMFGLSQEIGSCILIMLIVFLTIGIIKIYKYGYYKFCK